MLKVTLANIERFPMDHLFYTNSIDELFLNIGKQYDSSTTQNIPTMIIM